MNSEEKIIARISALLAKTEDAGASEDEALAAAEKARELVDRYQIDMRKVAQHAEASGRRIGTDERVFQPSLRQLRLHDVRTLFGSIGEYCDVVILTTGGGPGEPDKLTIVGEPIDCRMAYFMISNLRSALDRAYGRSRLRARHRSSFMFGACVSISERLDGMVEERRARHRSNGTDLVVVKTKAVQEECDRLFPDVRLRRLRTRKADIAMISGIEAGQDIPIQQGVESAAAAGGLLAKQ